MDTKTKLFYTVFAGLCLSLILLCNGLYLLFVQSNLQKAYKVVQDNKLEATQQALSYAPYDKKLWQLYIRQAAQNQVDQDTVDQARIIEETLPAHAPKPYTSLGLVSIVCGIIMIWGSILLLHTAVPKSANNTHNKLTNALKQLTPERKKNLLKALNVMQNKLVTVWLGLILLYGAIITLWTFNNNIYEMNIPVINEIRDMLIQMDVSTETLAKPHPQEIIWQLNAVLITFFVFVAFMLIGQRKRHIQIISPILLAGLLLSTILLFALNPIAANNVIPGSIPWLGERADLALMTLPQINPKITIIDVLLYGNGMLACGVLACGWAGIGLHHVTLLSKREEQHYIYLTLLLLILTPLTLLAPIKAHTAQQVVFWLSCAEIGLLTGYLYQPKKKIYRIHQHAL